MSENVPNVRNKKLETVTLSPAFGAGRLGRAVRHSLNTSSILFFFGEPGRYLISQQDSQRGFSLAKLTHYRLCFLYRTQATRFGLLESSRLSLLSLAPLISLAESQGRCHRYQTRSCLLDTPASLPWPNRKKITKPAPIERLS